MHTILKTAAFALGTVALTATAGAQPTARAPQTAAKAPPAPNRPPRRAPKPYKPEPAVTASFEGRSANFTGVIDPATGQMCYMLNAAGIAGTTAAKIVAGQPGKPGQAVVTLAPPADGSSGTCATIGAGTAQALLEHPGNYAVELDNATYPHGAAVAPLRAETYG